MRTGCGIGGREQLQTFDEALAEKEAQLHSLRDAHATLSSNAGKIGTVVSRAAVVRHARIAFRALTSS